MKQILLFGFLCTVITLFPEIASAAEEGKQHIEIDGEITTFVERALNMIIGFLGEFLTLIGDTIADILGRN